MFANLVCVLCDRGGAWVVVDSTINSDVMEFYASEEARGGVLEPTGTASIKYRDAEIRQAAYRIDGVLSNLLKALAKLSKDDPNNTSARKELERQLLHREKNVLGVFRQSMLCYPRPCPCLLTTIHSSCLLIASHHLTMFD